ncbi:hypothetical protein N7475_000787 [Penicillium sp. IBT 31633x]|nr:hypothetical protein N7475_000787 [Penicillium sp. IBT 31633x]
MAQSRDDWGLAKLLLSRVVSEDVRFLLLGLEYSQARLQGDLFGAYDFIEQLEKEYPDPRLQQVSFELDIKEARMRGRDDKLDHYRGLLRASRKKIGSLWRHPQDFRRVFHMMAADMRRARDKAWYAHPARAKKTAPESDSGPVPVPDPQFEPQFQLQSRHEYERQQPGTAAEPRLLQEIQAQSHPQPVPQAQAQPGSSLQLLRLRRELELLKVESAWRELLYGQDKAISYLVSASSAEAKESLTNLRSERSKTLELLHSAQSRRKDLEDLPTQ